MARETARDRLLAEFGPHYQSGNEFCRISNTDRKPTKLAENRFMMATLGLGQYLPLNRQFDDLGGKGTIVIKNDNGILGTVETRHTRPLSSILRVTPTPRVLELSMREYDITRFWANQPLPERWDPEGYLELDITSWPPRPQQGDQVCAKTEWTTPSTDPSDPYFTRTYKRYVIRKACGDHIWVLQVRSLRKGDEKLCYTCEVRFIPGLGTIVPSFYLSPNPIFFNDPFQYLLLNKLDFGTFQRITNSDESPYSSLDTNPYDGVNPIAQSNYSRTTTKVRMQKIPKGDGTFRIQIIPAYDDDLDRKYFHQIVPEGDEQSRRSLAFKNYRIAVESAQEPISRHAVLLTNPCGLKNTKLQSVGFIGARPRKYSPNVGLDMGAPMVEAMCKTHQQLFVERSRRHWLREGLDEEYTVPRKRAVASTQTSSPQPQSVTDGHTLGKSHQNDDFRIPRPVDGAIAHAPPPPCAEANHGTPGMLCAATSSLAAAEQAPPSLPSTPSTSRAHSPVEKSTEQQHSPSKACPHCYKYSSFVKTEVSSEYNLRPSTQLKSVKHKNPKDQSWPTMVQTSCHCHKTM